MGIPEKGSRYGCLLSCEINGKTVPAKITENLGYQGGQYVKAVEYDGKEYIVAKYGDKWKTRQAQERFI